MSSLRRLSDLEGGPYPPVTKDEIEGAELLLRDRFNQALRTFLISVNADMKTRKTVEVMADGMLSDIVEEATAIQMTEIED